MGGKKIHNGPTFRVGYAALAGTAQKRWCLNNCVQRRLYANGVATTRVVFTGLLNGLARAAHAGEVLRAEHLGALGVDAEFHGDGMAVDFHGAFAGHDGGPLA